MDATGDGIANLDGGALGGDAISMDQFCGTAGEFTLEALIRLPSLTGANREIICMDSSASPRPFQFRVTSTGQIEFNNIGTSGANPKVTIPTTGADAFVADQWFHVALTYDGAGTINVYWTRLDNARTGATLLQSFTDIPALVETGSAVLTVGNENRSTSGEGLTGFIDEVRISRIARGPTDMIFDTSAPPIPPTINPQPENMFLGVGETMTIQSHASGSPVLSYIWQKDGGTGFTNIPLQTLDILSLPVTPDTAGQYRYIVSNSYGSITSAVATVTVGGLFAGLFRTGFDDNYIQLEDGVVDPHYTLWDSADVAALGPDLIALPVTDNTYNANDENSRWISPYSTLGGTRGSFTYRTKFVVDSADPSAATLTASILTAGPTTILLNGKATGVANPTPPFPGPYRNLFTFTLTNGFVAGVNTLDFVVDNSSTAVNAVYGTVLRVTSIRGVGIALPAGLPSIETQPTSKTVKDGGRVTFSVVALGRAPLRYQWYDASSGAAIADATNWTLIYNPVSAGTQPSKYKVVVSNDSGSVTSSIVDLAIAAANQNPVVSDFYIVSYQGQSASISASTLYRNATDPDSDMMLFGPVDSMSTNAATYGTNNVEQSGVMVNYYPVEKYIGQDLFTYGISDIFGGSAVGLIKVLSLGAAASQMVLPGGTATFSVGLATPPAGYSFQWQRNGEDLAGKTGGVLTLSNLQLGDAGSYSLMVTAPDGTKWVSPIAGLSTVAPGSGTGLTGNYYNLTNGAANFEGPPVLTRVDAEINFAWAGAQPNELVSATDFMVRWHGKVQPLYSDVYTFSTATDDGSRLWVNGTLLVNDWTTHGVTTNSGTVALTAGAQYDIVVEYYQGTGGSGAYLLWQSEHQVPQLIPAYQLFPGTGLLQPTLSVALAGSTNVTVNWAGTFNLKAATSVTGPWTDIGTNTIGPMTFDIQGNAQRYFRLATPQ
jgi:hypothetical protein